jgi:hypothetical protein
VLAPPSQAQAIKVPPDDVVKIWQVLPGGQGTVGPHVHLPPEQAPLGQSVPQFPQLLESVCRFTQLPLQLV